MFWLALLPAGAATVFSQSRDETMRHLPDYWRRIGAAPADSDGVD